MGSNANKGTRGEGTPGGQSKAGWILLGAAAVLAAGSIGYNVYDSGTAQARVDDIADAAPTIDELRATAEESRDNAQPWSDLAFAYFERGDFADAASAYERAVAIDGGEAVLLSALGESLVYASARDPLPPAALEAFERALELDPGDPRARYFMAVKKDLAGDHEGSIADWLALLEDSPTGAPWEADLVRTIQQVGAINDIDVEPRLAEVQGRRGPAVMMPGSGDIAGTGASPNLRGPDAQQVAEASRLPPGEQRTMAEGMVARLEERLESDPGNLDGWLMLMRSRMTLGEPDRARAALASAIAANPGETQELREQAQRLGIR
ncbi:MAG: tetratricopeptide repeat protein [Erythrobacter sp.]